MCYSQKPNSLKALQDDCWDQICPFKQGSSEEMKKEKIACFEANVDKICECCNSRGLSDCKVLIPDTGLVDACSWNPVNLSELTDEQIENIKNKLALAIKGDNNDMDDSTISRLVNCIYPEMEKMAGIEKMKNILSARAFDIEIFSDDEKAKLDGIVQMCSENVINKRGISNFGVSKISRNIPKNVLIGLLTAFILLIVLSVFFSMKK